MGRNAKKRRTEKGETREGTCAFFSPFFTRLVFCAAPVLNKRLKETPVHVFILVGSEELVM